MEPISLNPTSQVNVDFLLFESRPGVAAAILPDAPRFTVVAVTHDFLQSVGMKKEDIVGKGHFEPFPENPDDKEFTGENNIRAAFESVIQQKKPYELPVQRYDIPNGDGTFTERYWKPQGSPVLSETGEVLYIIHAPVEVTDQVKAERKEQAHQELIEAYHKIEESEAALQQFKFMADNAQDPFILMREDGTFAYLNQKALEAWDYTKEEAKGIRVPDVNPIYNDELFSQAFARAQKEEIPTFETLHRRKNGHIYPVEVNMGGLTLNGKPHMFAVARDISDRKQFETSIKESTAKWQQLANAMPVIVWTGEVDGRINFLNSQWYEFTGLTESESVNFGWTAVLHPDDVDRCLAVWENARKNEVLYEINVRYRSKTGEYRWVLGRGVPIKNEKGCVVAWYGTSTDIHEQIMLAEELEKRVQERTQELENQNHLLDSILKNSSNGISLSRVFRDDYGNVVDALTILANDSAARYVGIPKEDYLSKRATEIEPEVMGSPYYHACIKTLETGEPFIMQYQMHSTGRWLELTVSRLDRDHLIQIFTDVTSIKEAQLQLEQSVENLKQANESLEEFAYAASHDLKEPIRKIHFFSDRLRQQLADKLSEEQKMSFQRLENASRRMGSLIDDLLSYSYAAKGLPEKEEVDLNKKIQLVLEDLEVEVQQNGAQISVEHLPVIKGSKRQIQQLFQNLITNALKYRKPGVAPEIKITYQQVIGRETKRDLHVDEKDKFFHLIKVHDNGIGFSQEDALRVFNVFTRLHGNSEYKGTGVGLSIAKKVVQNHGGYIWAESSPDKGATFKILLPVE